MHAYFGAGVVGGGLSWRVHDEAGSHIFYNISMKTVQQLQEEVYDQAVSSGYFRNMQAQLKSYVFDVLPGSIKVD